jgi:hypothetical protein
MRRWLAAIALAILSLSAAGCARHNGDQNSDLPALSATSTHWGIVDRTTAGNTMVVGILRPGTDHGIEILCDENANKLGIMVWPKEPFEAPAERLTLALAFDDGDPISQIWNKSTVGFDYWNRNPGFHALVDQLRSHRSVTVIMGSKESAQSEVFPLEAAGAAIDRVYAACGIPIARDPEHRVASEHWEVMQLPDQTSPIAAVADSTAAADLILSCKNVELRMRSQKGLPLEVPSLTLSWDGEVNAATAWNYVADQTGWAFAVNHSAPGFWPAIWNLSQFKSLEATISDTGTAPQHYWFSMVGAETASDYVLALCGKPKQ